MDAEKIIRRLAKTNKYQTLYAYGKESGLSLFSNTTDYTAYQILFLNYLGFYYTIYLDVALDDISEIVLEDEIYEDSYMFYKRKQGMMNYKKISTPGVKKDAKAETKSSFQWVFKKPKK